MRYLKVWLPEDEENDLGWLEDIQILLREEYLDGGFDGNIVETSIEEDKERD